MMRKSHLSKELRCAVVVWFAESHHHRHHRAVPWHWGNLSRESTAVSRFPRFYCRP